MKWGVVVAAGGYADAALSQTIGTDRKALAMLQGKTSLQHTLDAVREAGQDRCVTVGPVEIAKVVGHGDFVPEGETAIDNVLLGVEHLGEIDAALLLPSDSPMIQGPMLACFVEKVSDRVSADVWFAAGLCPARDFVKEFPGTASQTIKLREGPHLSGALYATTPKGLVQAAEIFRQARRSRKNQLKLLSRFGFASVLLYFTRRIDIPRAERVLTRGLGGPVFLVPDCHPATCYDFDTAEEFEAIRAVMEAGERP